ncbi:MAG TPA: crossover junction endodeoxyribonuclease RuvC [Clostridiaceae bacterium]|nr:crossover junction endodeoxyribonuclease RuvC [Clostridiaceae bacterium]
MIILGIDPGYAITGYALIDYTDQKFKVLDYGLVTTKANSYFPERLLLIERSLETLINKYKPDVMAIEELFFNRNTTTAIGTAQARGVAVVTGARNNIPVFEYTPKQVKLAVTGYGNSDKIQVQEMVKILLKLNKIPEPDDVADALAVALCHAHSGNRSSALAVGGYQ